MKKRSKFKRYIMITMWLVGAFGAGLGCIPIILVGVLGFIYGIKNYDNIDWGEEYVDY